MPQESSSEQDPDESDAEFVEVDPSGRYGRYKEVLGRGAFKKVYRAFDELEGIEVAWNQVKLVDLLRNAEDLERLYSEVHLLKTLKHKNIIKFYNSWVDTKNEHINFITEIFTSGTLRQYRKKHKHVDLRALKKWSRQILEGLLYLHSHDPPVIHRDLKCDNIFVNGNQGEVKIGDLGLAAILRQARSAHSVIGTPEFMAPELYEEEYNELVDIYAFGMCLLELVTFEYPYIECANAAQIYKKVTSGIKPASLAKVKDPGVRAFIEKCIAKVTERLPAKELLMDPFLRSDDENDSIGRSLQHNSHVTEHRMDEFDDDKNIKDSMPETSRDFTVQGQRKDQNTIFLKLRIADSTGHIRNIHFPFDIEADTSTSVASEMVEELDLTDQDVSMIASMIDSEIRFYIQDWAPGEQSHESVGGEVVNSDYASEAQDEASPLSTNDFVRPSALLLERLPSGKKYWCDSPRSGGGSSPIKLGFSNLSLVNDRESDDSRDVVDSKGVASLERLGDEDALNVNAKVTHSHAFTVSDVSHVRSDEMPSGNGPCLSEGTNTTQKDTDSDYVQHIVEKLKHLFVKQKKELYELKKKHEMEVSELLKELPADIRCNVFSFPDLTISDYKMHYETCSRAEKSGDSDSFLQIKLKDFHVAREYMKESASESRIWGPVFRGNFNSAQGNTKAGLGIAVIL